MKIELKKKNRTELLLQGIPNATLMNKRIAKKKWVQIFETSDKVEIKFCFYLQKLSLDTFIQYST